MEFHLNSARVTLHASLMEDMMLFIVFNVLLKDVYKIFVGAIDDADAPAAERLIILR